MPRRTVKFSPVRAFWISVAQEPTKSLKCQIWVFSWLWRDAWFLGSPLEFAHARIRVKLKMLCLIRSNF